MNNPTPPHGPPNPENEPFDAQGLHSQLTQLLQGEGSTRQEFPAGHYYVSMSDPDIGPVELSDTNTVYTHKPTDIPEASPPEQTILSIEARDRPELPTYFLLNPSAVQDNVFRRMLEGFGVNTATNEPILLEMANDQRADSENLDGDRRYGRRLSSLDEASSPLVKIIMDDYSHLVKSQ